MRNVKQISRPEDQQRDAKRGQRWLPIQTAQAIPSAILAQHQHQQQRQQHLGWRVQLCQQQPSQAPVPSLRSACGWDPSSTRTSWKAARNTNSAPMPSVVVTEKFAISDGVNANSASGNIGRSFREQSAAREPQCDSQRESEQRVHGARVPCQPLRAGLHGGHVISARQRLLRDLDIGSCNRQHQPKAAQRRMVGPHLELTVPRLQSGDHVAGLVVGERLRLDEPQRLQTEQQKQRRRDPPSCVLGFVKRGCPILLAWFWREGGDASLYENLGRLPSNRYAAPTAHRSRRGSCKIRSSAIARPK